MTCPLCLGSGMVAVGPWGSRPPKKTCPVCNGSREVREEDLAEIAKEYVI